MAFIEKKADELIDLYYEQANVFSGVVGILGIRRRFPDLSLDGKLSPPPNQALESKGSSRPWAVQSHYNHSGWYIVWRYAIDPTKRMKGGRAVVIWRIDIPFLIQEDWK